MNLDDKTELTNTWYELTEELNVKVYQGVKEAQIRAYALGLKRMAPDTLELLVEIEREFGVDGYGMPFEDGESQLIDRVRAAIAKAKAKGGAA